MAGLGTDGTLALLTRTIVQVGHDLGIEVVAEGIERPEQLELLRAMGCGLGQGYLVARPMAARGIEALAAAGEPGAGEAGGAADEDEADGHDTGRQPGPPAGRDRTGGAGGMDPTGPAGATGPAEPSSASRDAPAAAPAT